MFDNSLREDILCQGEVLMTKNDIISLLDQPVVGIDTARQIYEGAAGVYALMDDDENVLYVGQSGNFAQRLARHVTDKKKKGVTKCCLAGVPDAGMRLIQETIWIALLRPPLNTAVMLRIHSGKLTEIRYRRRKTKSA
jgi:hypothetical protein